MLWIVCCEVVCVGIFGSCFDVVCVVMVMCFKFSCVWGLDYLLV